jgi:hypothetical protein
MKKRPPLFEAVEKTLIGLVDAFGSAGGSIGGTDQWSLIFNLAAWKQEGAVSEGKLRCELPVTKEELSNFMGAIKAYKIVEINVSVYTNTGAAVLKSVEVLDRDLQLEAISAELQKPVKVDTVQFGTLELDRRLGDYKGVALWCGTQVGISLSCADIEKPFNVIAVASELFSAQSDWNSRVQAFAVERLLPLKNDSWLDEGDFEVSPEEFVSKMTLEEISFDEGGAFSFWHDDGDLFWGHSIMVSGELGKGLTDADIPG